MSRNQEHSFAGKWWIAGNRNDQTGGTLELGSSYTLETVEELRDKSGFHLRDLGMFTVNGQSLGQCISMFDCYERSETYHPENIHHTIIASSVLIGPAHIEDAQEARFDWASFRLQHIDQFANRRIFAIEHGNVVDTVSVSHPEALVAEIPGARLRLERLGGSSWDSLDRVELRSNEVLFLELDDAVSLDDLFYLYVRPLRQLMSLATAESCELTDLRVGKRDEMDSPLDVYSVHGWQKHETEERPVIAHNMRFSLDATIGRPHFELAELIPRWFKVSAKYGPVLDLVFSLHEGIGYLENNVFAIASALEGVHSKLFSGAGRRTVPQTERLESVLRSAPSEHREWLARALARSHEPSFAERIRQLVAYAGEAVAHQLGDLDKWTSLVAQARNNIAHAKGIGATNIARTVRLMQSMQMLAEVVLLREIGLSQQTCADLLKSDYEWRQVRPQLIRAHPELFA
jgi:hypothetical protein